MAFEWEEQDSLVQTQPWEEQDPMVSPSWESVDAIDKPASGFVRGFFEKPEEKIPVLGLAIKGAKFIRVVGATQRLQQGWDYSTPISPETMMPGAMGIKPALYATKESDIRDVENYLIDLERQYSTAGKAGQILSEMPSFAVSFMLTGGLQATGSAAGRAAISKLLGRYATTTAGRATIAAGGFSAGAALRSVGMPIRAANAIIRRQAPQDINIDNEGNVAVVGPIEKSWTSVYKGLADHYIEIASEQAGEFIAPGISKFIKRTPFLGKALSRIQTRWLKLNPGKKSADFLKVVGTKTGFHGVLGEVGEEYLGDITRAITDVEHFGAGEDAGMFERVGAAVRTDTENLPAMLLAFAVPGVVTSQVSSQLQKMKDIDDKFKKHVDFVAGLEVNSPTQIETSEGALGFEEDFPMEQVKANRPAYEFDRPGVSKYFTPKWLLNRMLGLEVMLEDVDTAQMSLQLEQQHLNGWISRLIPKIKKERGLARLPAILAAELPTPQKIKPEQIIRNMVGTIGVDLPPVKEGYMRLYRGQHPTFQKDLFHPKRGILTDEEIKQLELSQGKGGWFTPFVNYALNYAEAQGEGYEIVYVDVPVETAEKYRKEEAPKGLSPEGYALEYFFPELRDRTETKAHILQKKIGKDTEQLLEITFYFHGSPIGGLTEIKPSMGDYGTGIYFTDDRAIAEWYSRDRKEAGKYVLGEREELPPIGNLYPVMPNLNNPLMITEDNFEALENEARRKGFGDDYKGIADLARQQDYDGIINEINREHVQFVDKSIPVIQPDITKTKAHILQKKISDDTDPIHIMRDLLDTYDDAPAFLNESETRLFNQVREVTRYLRKRANLVRERMGLPLIQDVRGYITHWLDSTANSVVAKDLPIHSGYLYKLMQGLPKIVKNPTAMRRQVRGLMEKYFSKDLGRLLRTMVTFDLKDIYLKQPYEAAWDELQALRAQRAIPDSTYKVAENYLLYDIRKHAAPMDKAFNRSLKKPIDLLNKLLPVKLAIDDPARNIFSFMRRLGFMSGLGLRLKPAGRNLGQRLLLTDLYRTVDYAKAQAVAFRLAKMPVIDHPITGEPIKIIELIREQDWYKMSLRKFEDQVTTITGTEKAGLYLYSRTHVGNLFISNVEVSALTGYFDWQQMRNKSKDVKSLHFKNAIRFSKRTGVPVAELLTQDSDMMWNIREAVRRSQWEYFNTSMPVIYRSQFNRAMLMFQSWWMNYFFNHSREMINQTLTGRNSLGRLLTPGGRLRAVKGLGTIVAIGKASKALLGIEMLKYLFIPVPGYLPPIPALIVGILEFFAADDERERKRAWVKIKRGLKFWVPFSAFGRDLNKLLSGEYSIGDFLFYRPKEKK